MATLRQPVLADLERREKQSAIFVCSAIATMGIGSALGRLADHGEHSGDHE